MSQVLAEVLEANRTYPENFGDRGSLPLPPSRQEVIKNYGAQ
jgi:hypothetical protein